MSLKHRKTKRFMHPYSAWQIKHVKMGNMPDMTRVRKKDICAVAPTIL